MNKSVFVIYSIIASLPISVYAQSAKAPAEVVADGFSDVAGVYLKKHPEIEKCANRMADENNNDRRKQGLEERTTYVEYGEFIGICAEKYSSKMNPSKKMKGDQVDNDQNAKPNGSLEAQNKRNKKPWQDENGFIHFPDGSMTNSPVD